MPKTATFPPLYDEALQIHISNLKKWGYLEPNQFKTGTIKWSRNGNPNGSISISINTNSERPYIILDYKFRDEPRNYKVYLTSTPSNIKKGKVWYFICPKTNKRCRKLYSIDGYFLHREAFKGCFYESQTHSKKYRQLEKTLGMFFKGDSLYSEPYKKHFKKTYAGKHTKRYLRIMEQIQKSESIPYHEVEKFLISGK